LEYQTTKDNNDAILLKADRTGLTQVLSNLLSNAAKFTTQGKIMVTAEKKRSQAFVRIKDTGVGILPEIMPKLFSKFATNSPSGTGIIEAHRGHISAENNIDGKGATFTFSLPIYQGVDK
jgi:signal transduction histidine kinase